MKCTKCKLEIPSDAEVCGYCGNSTEEQRKNRGLFYVSFIVAFIPRVILVLNNSNKTILLWGGVCVVVGTLLIFKLLFKGAFSKTGF